jgi:septum formation protein
MLVLASASPRRSELLAQAGFSFQVHPAHIPEDPHLNEDPIAYVTRLAREKAQSVFRQLTQDPARSNDSSALHNGTTLMVEEEPVRAVGSGFIPDISAMESSRASAPEGSLSSRATAGAPGLDSETCETGSTVKGTGFSPYVHTAKESGALAPEGILSESLAVLGADTTVTLDNHILGKPEDPADAARILRLLSGRTHRVITGVALVTAERTEVAAEVTSVKFLSLSDEEIAAYIATGEPMDKAGAYAIQGRAARWIPRIEGDYFNVVGLPIALVSTLLESLAPFHRR